MSTLSALDALPSSSAGSGTLPLASGVLPAIPSLTPTYGSILIGTALALILYGLTLHQAYRYARLYPTDPTWLKYYVTVLVIMDTLQSVLSTHTCYWYLVTNYFNPTHLYTGVWSLNMLSVVQCSAIVICQCFYTRQVYILIKAPYKYIVVLVAVVMGTIGTGASIADSAEAFIQPNFAEYQKFLWLVAVSFGPVIATDIMLTSILVFTLHRSRTGFKRTDSLIDTLILYSICTGLITDLFGIVTFILALVLPNDLIWVGVSLVTTKLYVNCVLAALNTRKSIFPGDVYSSATAGTGFNSIFQTGTPRTWDHGGGSTMVFARGRDTVPVEAIEFTTSASTATRRGEISDPDFSAKDGKLGPDVYGLDA
ncbi:hypothetical protein GY45DRAFT_518824 [Cubamyces sp. BRFM 1775]|nr:hypothetical protein GY45DRAFT_518824 [Cubamyces sp. BRFM 1775]